MVEDYAALDVIHPVDFDKLTQAIGNTLGDGVILGLGFSVAGGDVNVTVQAGTARVGGQLEGFNTTTVINFTSDQDATNPKKALIVIDSSGSIIRRLGAAGVPDPAGEVRRKTLVPIPPELTAGDVVLYEVWIPKTGTNLVTADVSDRRINARDDPLDPANQFYFFDDWLMNQTGIDPPHDVFVPNTSSSATVLAAFGVPNGRLRLSTGTSINSIARWESPITTFRRDDKAIFEVRIQLSGALTEHEATLGFTDALGLILPSSTGQTVALFTRDAGGSSTNWIAMTNDGTSGGNTTDTGVAPVLGTPQTLRVEMDDSPNQVRFYIDGTLVATHTTDLPAVGTAMYVSHVNKTTNTVDKDLDLDYTLIRAERV